MNRLNGKIAVSGNLGGDIGANGKMSGRLGAAQKVYVKELYFGNRFEFPAVGEPDKLYIAKDEDMSYRFDEDEMAYKPLGLQLEDIKHINGGNANGQQST